MNVPANTSKRQFIMSFEARAPHLHSTDLARSDPYLCVAAHLS